MDAATLIQHGMNPDEAYRAIKQLDESEEKAVREGIAIKRNVIARTCVARTNHRTNR